MRTFHFARHTRFVSVIVDRTYRGSFNIDIHMGYRRPPFNKGAGYIGGATLYFAWRCRNIENQYRPSWLQIGITRNANKVPVPFYS
jgi:hypothetical protein